MANGTTTFLYVALGLVVAVTFWYLYQYLKGYNKTVLQTTYLKTQSTELTLSNYSNPTTVRCCYSFWLFVNTLSATTATDIFKCLDSAGGTEKFKLRLDTQAKLSFFNGSTEYVLMADFPLQKWARFDLSFDNSVFDFYYDGKLLRSFQMSSSITLAATALVQFGTFDAFLYGFDRIAEPMNPAKAQADYLHGQKSLTGTNFPSYGIQLQLTKDSAVQKSFGLF